MGESTFANASVDKVGEGENGRKGVFAPFATSLCPLRLMDLISSLINIKHGNTTTT